MELSQEELERIVGWYEELNPNTTHEEDFLPDAELARKIMVEAGQDTDIQDRYIKELKENRE